MYLFAGTKSEKEVGCYDRTDLPTFSQPAVDPDPRASSYLLLVEHYIAEGTPVASKALATLPGVAVSSATVRNVMSDLESMGLVRSPHTSAGKFQLNRD